MFIKPVLPPYDPLVWRKKPFSERARLVCHAWALQGYGTPLAVYFVYLLKIAAYVGGWAFFTRGLPLFDAVAFQKAILWSCLFELLGLGCGSGPLTGRYLPPLGGALYFLRTGTTKLPLFGTSFRRGFLDVGSYALVCGLLLASCIATVPPFECLVGLAVALPVLGVLDKTLFLCARGEHYWTTITVFVLAGAGGDWLPGAKCVHAALWFWAGMSKLNHHFPSVVGVMTSNSPFTRVPFVRRLMYRRYPDDLSPSTLAVVAGHIGTAIELAVPLLLLSGRGGALTLYGLVLMVVLHTFITSNVPMAVPLEWNVMMVYGGFFLFWKNAAVSAFDLSATTAALVVVMCVVVPFVGNVLPSRVSFLLAMRYYAGNWPYSVWLFRGTSHEKLERLTKSAPWIHDQLQRLYDEATSVAIVGKVMAFRLMHLHGRALCELVPRAIDVERLADYEWVDGEIVAGLVLGWNFGDGHLHDEQLLAAVQAQCAFEEGELRCIMVESQPLFASTLRWRIIDAKTGEMAHGHVRVSELRARQPWDLVRAAS